MNSVTFWHLGHSLPVSDGGDDCFSSYSPDFFDTQNGEIFIRHYLSKVFFVPNKPLSDSFFDSLKFVSNPYFLNFDYKVLGDDRGYNTTLPLFPSVFSKSCLNSIVFNDRLKFLHRSHDGSFSDTDRIQSFVLSSLIFCFSYYHSFGFELLSVKLGDRFLDLSSCFYDNKPLNGDLSKGRFVLNFNFVKERFSSTVKYDDGSDVFVYDVLTNPFKVYVNVID